VKTPLPEKPEPFSVGTTSLKLGLATSTNLELIAVWFEAVSKIKTADWPLISTVISIKPKARLKRSGISIGFDGCGETGNPRATAKSKATVHRQTVLKATDSLAGRLSAQLPAMTE